MYETYMSIDDSLRRIANQAFFDRILVYEDTIEADPGEPFNILLNPALHADAIHATTSTNTSHDGAHKVDVQTQQVVGLNIDPMVDLSGGFSNPRTSLKTLISQVLRGKSVVRRCREPTSVADARGLVRENSLQSQTRLTPQEITELLAGHEAGTSVKALAKQFGIHRLTVSQIAKRAGIEPRRSRTTPTQRKQAAALYAEGYSLSQVAAKAGISAPAVRAAVVMEGRTVRPKGHPSRLPVQSDLGA
jgi:transposase-like protein